MISGGGVFRNCWGFVTTYFHVKSGHEFAFEAELIAVIYALELAQTQGLDSFLLEPDSTYVVSLLQERSTIVSW